MTRKETEKRRIPPGQDEFVKDNLAVLNKMGWYNAKEVRTVLKTDAWHTCIKYGYYVCDNA